uniref:Ig-like domain-containing protein n=1 Tax=Caenorhabditis tropicalis TaxID=1561998 RepID=A0A1I7U3S5_9PELO
MRSLIIFLSLIPLSYAFGVAEYKDVTVGQENVILTVADGNVKVIKRMLDGSDKHQIWNVSRGTWIDETGKPVPSSNYSFKAPGTIIIRIVTKEDAGFYDYDPEVDVADAQKNLPEGEFVDIDPMLTGIQLSVLS